MGRPSTIVEKTELTDCHGNLFGNFCASQVCLRRARRVKRKASRNPSTAPISVSEIVRLSSDLAPLPAIRNPQYAKATVQRMKRTLVMGPPKVHRLMVPHSDR